MTFNGLKLVLLKKIKEREASDRFIRRVFGNPVLKEEGVYDEGAL